MEVWKDIKGYEGVYRISSIGNVGTIKYRKLMKPYKVRSGYLMIKLSGLERTNNSVHRLVSEAFIPNPENKPQVNHINDIKTDNRVENLEWCTASDNQLHSIRIGLKQSSFNGDYSTGERNSMSKLTEEIVLNIRHLIDKKNATRKTLARKYNVHTATIDKIVSRRSWEHI